MDLQNPEFAKVTQLRWAMTDHPCTPYLPLFDCAQLRALEQSLARCLPPHTLMARAGMATAQLALAVAPHARRIWVVCGAGNNGGDGLEAAMHLATAGKSLHISIPPSTGKATPTDAALALNRLKQAGLACSHSAATPGSYDLAIDALWGIGLRADWPMEQQPWMTQWLHQLYRGSSDVLSVDIPSGLLADTGSLLAGMAAMAAQPPLGRRFTLTLLGAKPGLFTHQGKQWAGQVWLAPLTQHAEIIEIGCNIETRQMPETVSTKKNSDGELLTHAHAKAPSHDAHKGQFGDVGVIGGQSWAAHGMGMEGAAILAATAALHSGAGRVMLHLLGTSADSPRPSGIAPDIMLRSLEAMLPMTGALVFGCGAGSFAADAMAQALNHAGPLVLDADALNCMATDAALQQALALRGKHHVCVLTPHPLELARLLDKDTAHIQADRIGAARTAAQRFDSIVVLKGSGTVIAAPNGRYAINHSGNERLAIGGTGDVLAGCIGAQLAPLRAQQVSIDDAWQPVLNAVWLHGHTAERWPETQTLTASRLAQALQRLPGAFGAQPACGIGS